MIIQVNNPIVEVHNLTVTYQKKPAIWNIDFSLPSASIVGIVGPNGAGKSTVTKAIMGLVSIASGYVKLWEQPLDKVRKRVSYMPQRETIDWDFPASALDIALMGRYGQMGLWKRLSKQDREIAHDALQKVGMTAFANRQISQLSGGQQQRVFLARALAQQADLYLMDEPFAGVDATTENAILQLMTDMRNEGKTIIVVHHDLQSAYQYFDWIVMLNTKLVASGPKEQVFNQELLNETYGGKLTLLSKLSNLMKQKEFPV